MKQPIPKHRLLRRDGILAFVTLCLMAYPMALASAPSTAIAFEVATDKVLYSPGSTMQVKFIIINSGAAPVYIPRGLSECSYIGGSFFVQILDGSGRDVRTSGCSSDVDPSWEAAELQRITNQEFWIVLKPGEIFGAASTLELPKRKGTYRLKAELTPPGFSADVKKLLLDRGIRVLQETRPAPLVRIVVK